MYYRTFKDPFTGSPTKTLLRLLLLLNLTLYYFLVSFISKTLSRASNENQSNTIITYNIVARMHPNSSKSITDLL